MYSYLDCKHNHWMVCSGSPSGRLHLFFKHCCHEQCPATVPYQRVLQQSTMHRRHPSGTGSWRNSYRWFLYPCSFWYNLQCWCSCYIRWCWSEVSEAMIAIASLISYTDTPKIYSITRFSTASPFGLRQSAVTQSQFNSQHYYINVTWTPTTSQFGLNQFCFRAVSSNGWALNNCSELKSHFWLYDF